MQGSRHVSSVPGFFLQVLRSILSAVIAGTNPNLDINPAAQTYLQAELAKSQAGGGEGGRGGRGEGGGRGTGGSNLGLPACYSHPSMWGKQHVLVLPRSSSYLTCKYTDGLLVDSLQPPCTSLGTHVREGALHCSLPL